MIIFLFACSLIEKTTSSHDHEEAGHEEAGHEEAGHEEAGHEEAGHEEAEEHAPEVLVISSDLKRDLRISTVTAQAQTGTEPVTVLGEVRVHEDAEAVLVAPVGARVTRVLAATGASVKKGAALVELESVEVGHARAALLAARAVWAQQQGALERKKQLSTVVSAADLAAATADVAVAGAGLRAAEAALRALGVGLNLPDPVDGRFVLRAPVSGVVLERAVVLGAVVDREEVLFRVADLGQLQVEIHAFERDAVRFSVGDHADVEVSALPGRIFSATVARLGYEVEPASRTMAVRLQVASDGALRPGMAATASLTAAVVPAGVSVPGAALQRLEGGWVVFVPQGEGEFAIRPVGRGRDLGSEVEILSGITAGETVVLDGAFLLKAEAEKRQGGGGHHDH